MQKKDNTEILTLHKATLLSDNLWKCKKEYKKLV